MLYFAAATDGIGMVVVIVVECQYSLGYNLAVTTALSPMNYM
jgi:hypothetical protein